MDRSTTPLHSAFIAPLPLHLPPSPLPPPPHSPIPFFFHNIHPSPISPSQPSQAVSLTPYRPLRVALLPPSLPLTVSDGAEINALLSMCGGSRHLITSNQVKLSRDCRFCGHDARIRRTERWAGTAAHNLSLSSCFSSKSSIQ